MEISCPASSFNHALHSLHPIVPNHGERRQISYVTIEADEDGTVATCATNDMNIGIRTELRADVKTAGAVSFPFHALYKATGFLGDAPLVVKLKPRQVGLVRCMSYSAEIAGLEPRSTDLVPKALARNQPCVAASELKRAFRRTAIAASRQESVLNSICLAVKDDQIEMVATDRTRIAISRVPLIKGGQSSIVRVAVPLKTAEVLVALLPEIDAPAMVMLSGRSAVFQWPGITVQSPVLETGFPDIDGAVPSKYSVEMRLPRAKLVAVVGAVAPIATDRDHTVEMSGDKGKLHIRSDSPEIGSARDTIDAKEIRTRFNTAFNGAHLQQFLEAVDSDEVILGLVTGRGAAAKQSLCMLKPFAGGDYSYYIAPIVKGP